MEAFATDVTGAQFPTVVLEGSRQRPVIVDFWAPWCGPCRALGPILEKLAEEFEGRFLLARINSDDEPQLSARYGVRGIPNVKAFVDGTVVDEFSGALPETAVRQFLSRVVPSLAEPLRREAEGLRAAGDLEGALARLARAAELDPRHEPSVLDRADTLVELGRHDEASALLNEIEDRARDGARVARLRATLALAGASDDIEALVRRVGETPGDLGAKLELSMALAARGEHEAALAQALEIVRLDRAFGDDAGRRAMLRVFDLLGPDSDLARRYRRELAALINR
jgi:putative thioredoxin